MSTGLARRPGVLGSAHPAIVDRRARDLLAVGLTALIPAAIALAIILAVPEATTGHMLLVLALIVGTVGVVALIVSTRYEVTVALVGLYLLLLDGPVKLGLSTGELPHVVRNILILAICVGAVMRILVRREPVRLPPLCGWVFAFVAIVVLEAFNPKTEGILKVLGGFRQQLQWVPFFFFGYLLMRTKLRFRQYFLILGVCALANGIVATYQTGLSPAQIASWGPGYRELFQPVSVGGKAAHGRTYASEGEARARPVGLGSDSGFSGGVGLVALPACLALLATWRSRRRWVAAVLALGAILGVAAGLGRLQVVGALLGVVAFALLALAGGRHRITRPLVSIVTVAVLVIPVGALVTSAIRSGTFKRYETLVSEPVTSTATYKSSSYTRIPHFIERAPFGIGLGTVGPVGGFGGKTLEQQGQGNTSESQYNFIADELGAPGLVLWVALSLYVTVVVARGLRRVPDSDLVFLLAGACAPFIALIFMGFSGPLTASAALGPYYWFTVGIVAYWFGHRRQGGQLAIPAVVDR